MQMQDTPEMWLFKVWPWIEANKIRLAWGGGIVLVAVGLISFNSWHREQKELSAGQALSDVMMSDQRNTTAPQQAAMFVKVAEEHAGTQAGQRALLQSAGLLFDSAQYPEAQKQFQQYIDKYPGTFFAAQAALGVAACLEAEGKMDLAAAAYQRVVSNYSDMTVLSFAKLSLGRLDERAGKVTEAMNLYQEVAKALPNSAIGQEAAMRATELKTRPATGPAPATTTTTSPFQLSN